MAGRVEQAEIEGVRERHRGELLDKKKVISKASSIQACIHKRDNAIPSSEVSKLPDIAESIFWPAVMSTSNPSSPDTDIDGGMPGRGSFPCILSWPWPLGAIILSCSLPKVVATWELDCGRSQKPDIEVEGQEHARDGFCGEEYRRGVSMEELESRRIVEGRAAVVVKRCGGEVVM